MIEDIQKRLSIVQQRIEDIKDLLQEAHMIIHDEQNVYVLEDAQKFKDAFEDCLWIT